MVELLNFLFRKICRKSRKTFWSNSHYCWKIYNFSIMSFFRKRVGNWTFFIKQILRFWKIRINMRFKAEFRKIIFHKTYPKYNFLNFFSWHRKRIRHVNSPKVTGIQTAQIVPKVTGIQTAQTVQCWNGLRCDGSGFFIIILKLWKIWKFIYIRNMRVFFLVQKKIILLHKNFRTAGGSIKL